MTLWNTQWYMLHASLYLNDCNSFSHYFSANLLDEKSALCDSQCGMYVCSPALVTVLLLMKTLQNVWLIKAYE